MIKKITLAIILLSTLIFNVFIDDFEPLEILKASLSLNFLFS